MYTIALGSFGYTEDEARFLYLVATHSGYFTCQQFVRFIHAKPGKRSLTFATWLSESGATIRAAQDILGQTDMETTLRVYTHSVPDSKRRAIANVAALLFPSVPSEPLGAEEHRELPN